MDRGVLSALIDDAVHWLETQRNLYRPGARPLSDAERSELQRFFEQQTLDHVRVAFVTTVEPPNLSVGLPAQARRDLLLTFNRMAGITFIDTIAVSKTQMPLRSQLLPLLFHELIHVVQYEVLGLRPFMETYLRGWAENGFSYHSIPLERDAYELQEHYEVNSRARFSVAAEVRRRLGFG